MAPRSVAIDIIEENIKSISPILLNNLLKDMSTGENIIWATDDYSEQYGEDFRRNKKNYRKNSNRQILECDYAENRQN